MITKHEVGEAHKIIASKGDDLKSSLSMLNLEDDQKKFIEEEVLRIFK